jgi:hypothetical protein
VRLSSDAVTVVMMAGRRSRIVGTVAYSNRVEATKRRGIQITGMFAVGGRYMIWGGESEGIGDGSSWCW